MGPVPDHPHLILVPNTLIDQWFTELQVFFKRGSVDIFLYPTAAKDWKSFWDSNSPYSKSRQPRIRRIVLAAHSVCFRLWVEYKSLSSDRRLAVRRGKFSNRYPVRRLQMVAWSMRRPEGHTNSWRMFSGVRIGATSSSTKRTTFETREGVTMVLSRSPAGRGLPSLPQQLRCGPHPL